MISFTRLTATAAATVCTTVTAFGMMGTPARAGGSGATAMVPHVMWLNRENASSNHTTQQQVRHYHRRLHSMFHRRYRHAMLTNIGKSNYVGPERNVSGSNLNGASAVGVGNESLYGTGPGTLGHGRDTSRATLHTTTPNSGQAATNFHAATSNRKRHYPYGPTHNDSGSNTNGGAAVGMDNESLSGTGPGTAGSVGAPAKP